MIVVRWRSREPTLTRFEGIKEQAVFPSRKWSSPRDALAAAHVQCQRGGPVKEASACTRCRHLVSVRPGPGAAMMIRCLWCDDDPVEEVMTLAGALVTVSPHAPVARALDTATVAEARHLVVADGEEVIGVVCRCDLQPPVAPGETVRDRMSGVPWAIDQAASLGEALTVMREEHIGMLLVVRGDELAGVLTRGDLRRAGAPEELLGADHCVSCGSAHGVVEHGRLSRLPMCLECCERACDPVVDDELGGGD